jgi:hypothetical protein
MKRRYPSSIAPWNMGSKRDSSVRRRRRRILRLLWRGTSHAWHEPPIQRGAWPAAHHDQHQNHKTPKRDLSTTFAALKFRGHWLVYLHPSCQSSRLPLSSPHPEYPALWSTRYVNTVTPRLASPAYCSHDLHLPDSFPYALAILHYYLRFFP